MKTIKRSIGVMNGYSGAYSRQYSADYSTSASPVPVGVTQDGPLSWFVPTSSSDFTALSITTPTHVWPCQEASGNLVDVIDSVNLVPNASPLFQQSVTGWARFAVGITDGTSGHRFGVGAGTGPNPASVSVAWLIYLDDCNTIPSVERNFLLAGGNCVLAFLPTTGRIRCRIAGAAVADSVNNYCDGAPHAVLLVYNRTAGTSRIFTDLEQISPTFAAGATDGTKGFGATATSPLARCMYLWAAQGATAESYSKATLQALNVAIPY